MKRKVLCFVLTLLAIAVFSLGCGGGGGHSNPASPITSSNAKVSGVVVDSSKKPVADVRVRLVSAKNFQINSLAGNALASSRFSISGNDTEFNTITDKNGYYSFENVPLGRYSLSVDAGEQGALMPNLNVSLSETAVSELTITPFGFVSGTVEDENGKKIYGAMVNAGEHCAFTNNTGDFTLSHIPVGVNYELVTTLQGYEPTGTTEFTIPSDGDLTLTLSSPIVLKPDQTDSYNVPATVTATITSFQFPVFIIAEDPNSNDNLFFGILEEGAASCTLKITKAGSYKVFAISSDPEAVESQKVDLTVTKANISGNATNELVSIPFDDSSSTDGKAVIVKKVLPVDQYVTGTLNYYEGYVSCIGAEGTDEADELCYLNVDDESDNGMYSIESNAVYYGKYSVFYSNSGSSNVQFYYLVAEGEQPKTFTISSPYNDSSDSIGDIHVAFVPGKYVVANYGLSHCGSYSKYYVTKSFDDITNSISNDYGMGADSVYDNPKMAKDAEGNCYLAVTYSGTETISFKIYKVGTAGSTNPVVNYTFTSGEPYLKDFKVLKDGNFYVEMNINSYATGSTTTSKKSYIFEPESTTYKTIDESSNRVGCFVDSEGNMYRYDPNSKSVVKLAALDSSDPLDSYQFESESTTTLTDSDVNGVVGLEEDDDAVTIYAY